MNYNELFLQMKRERTSSGREQIISQAVEAGADLEVIREMLDVLDTMESRSAYAAKRLPGQARHARQSVLGAICGLLWPF